MIVPVNQQILNYVIRHGVYLERYKTSVANDILAMFNKDVAPDVERLLFKYFGSETITATKVKAFTSNLNDIMSAYTLMTDKTQQELSQFAISEADWQMAMLKNTVPVNLDFTMPSPKVLESLATKSYVRGALVEDWFTNLGSTLTQKVTQQINIGMVEGQGIADIVRRIKGTQAAGYSDGILDLSRRNIEAVVRTSVATVGNGARSELYQANTDVIGGEYWDATLDASTCEVCAALDRQEFEVGAGPMAPIHWNCLLPDNIVYADDIQAAHKVKYSGQVCEFGLADGRRFSVTRNHMLLTPWGFARADTLCEGDYVIDCLGFNTPTTDPNNNNSPARIDNIFKSLAMSNKMLAMTVPSSPEYFHGDGRFCDSDIEIVTSDSFLANDIKSLANKFFSEHSFGAKYSDLTGLSCLSNLNSMFLGLRNATDGGVGIRSEGRAFLCRHPGHPDNICLGTGANANPSFNKSFSNNGTGNIKTICEKQLGFPEFVSLDDFLTIERNLASVAFNIVSSQNPKQCGLSDFERIQNTLNTYAGTVKFARITFKNTRYFSGHVYDLQTKTTLYSVNGVVSSNCRCVRLPILKSWKALGIDLNEAPPSTRASMDGQVPESLSYASWLKTQDIETQNEVLGVGKATILRKGDITLDKFVDSRNRPLTLAELKDLESN